MASNRKITIFDVLLAAAFFIITFFVAQGWQNSLSNLFFTLSGVILVLYILGLLTGTLGFLSLSTPTWTISAILSLPLWLVVNAITPLGETSSSSVQVSGDSALADLIGAEAFNWITQVPVVVFNETVILVGLLLLLFGLGARSASKKKLSGNFKQISKDGRTNGFIVLFIGLLGGLAHYAIGLAVFGSTASFSIFIVHQFISFFIMTVFGFIFGLPGAIAAHWVKNGLVYGGAVGLVVSLALFVVFDLISSRLGGDQPASLKSLSRAVGLKKYA